MRYLLHYFRQAFCAHDFERNEMYGEETSGGRVVQSGPKISLLCKKCGYHRAFWKFGT